MKMEHERSKYRHRCNVWGQYALHMSFCLAILHFFPICHSFSGRGFSLKSGIIRGNADSSLWSSSSSETYFDIDKQREGLSKFHRRLLSSNTSRQRFVTGRYPLYVSIADSPTKKWLSIARKRIGGGNSNTESSAQVYVNGTLVDLGMASWDKLGWIETEEDSHLAQNNREHYSLELLAEIHSRKPCYVNVLSERSNLYINNDSKSFHQQKDNEMLWITDFSLTRPGGITKLDITSGQMERLTSSLTWPNEVTHAPVYNYMEDDSKSKKGNKAFEIHNECKLSEQQFFEDKSNDGDSIRYENDALLVTDGFLVPGRDDGGIYVIQQPGTSREWKVCVCGNDETGWFYHRAIWIDLTGDGRLSILAARVKRPIPGRSSEENVGELIFIERPKPHMYDEETGTPLDIDGTVFDPYSSHHLPWKTVVLDKGPDVMFCVADLDSSDNTVEVIASQFFGKKVTLHSVEIGKEPHVSFRRVIDEKCGTSFSAILADLDSNYKVSNSDKIRSGLSRVVDCGSTISTLKKGDNFSHILITSHECSFQEGNDEGLPFSDRKSDSFESSVVVGHNLVSKLSGGSLYAYKVPDLWRSQDWERNTIASGFRVQGQLGNMINPGAPGFCYTFYPTRAGAQRWSRPYIGIAGDCAEAAYILRPVLKENCKDDIPTDYALMCEINCGGTVGSLAIGYDNCCNTPSEEDWAKIYIPSYERDKIFVFGMGSGDE